MINVYLSEDFEAQLQNKELKIIDDSLEIEILIKIPQYWMYKRCIAKFTPILIIKNVKYDFSDIMIQGEKIKYQKFPVITYNNTPLSLALV